MIAAATPRALPRGRLESVRACGERSVIRRARHYPLDIGLAGRENRLQRPFGCETYEAAWADNSKTVPSTTALFAVTARPHRRRADRA